MTQPRGRIQRRRCSQADGLVLWYPLCSAESAATPNCDYSGKGTHLESGWDKDQHGLAEMPGYGRGLSFGATGAGRVITDNGTLDAIAGGPITISFWYYRTGTITADRILLGTGRASVGQGFAVAAAMTNNNNLGYFPGTGGLGSLSSNNYFNLGVRPQDTLEHHCITGVGATLTHYVVSAGVRTTTTWTLSGTQAQPTAWTGARYFGAHYDGSLPTISLEISDLRIYNRALSDAEAWSLYDPATRWDLWDTPRRIFGRASVSTRRRRVVRSPACSPVFCPVGGVS